MLKEEEMISDQSRWSLAERRAFMQLPLEERRQILTQQADDLLGYYRNEVNTQDRLDWQGGDVVER
jgi:hypothetical protein